MIPSFETNNLVEDTEDNKTTKLYKYAIMLPDALPTILFPTPGTGQFIYVEASYPRRFGDKARLESPWMLGPQCMTFYYHMFGSTMSCVVIYIRNQDTNGIKPVWFKSGNQGNRWIREQISINETGMYQVSLELCAKYDAITLYRYIRTMHSNRRF